MSTKIFVNLPVENLGRAKAFFEALGFRFNPQFTDETAACMVISEENYAMLLTHEKFQGFAPNGVADARKANEVLIALSRESRAAVDEVVDKAIAGGATTFREPQDHGFMYERSFQDLDGHVWEWMWMDPAALEPAS